MSRMVVAGTAPLRLALALVIGSSVALLLPALLATQVGSPSAVVLASLALVLAAVVGLRSHLASATPRGQAPRSRTRDRAAAFLADRVTDTPHHPLRPRAPGLV